MATYYIKYRSKIFNYRYEDKIEAETVNEAIAKFRRIHRDTAEIVEIVMAIECQSLVDEFDRQRGINATWEGEHAFE